MSGKDGREGLEDFGELQRRYLEAWQQLAGAGAPTGSPWSEALEHWWQVAAPAGAGTAGDVMARLLAQGQGFLWLGDRLAEAGGQDSGDPVRSLLDALDGGDGTVRQVLRLLQMPLETWQRAAAALSPVPGEAGDDGPASGEALAGEFTRLLSMPALGLTREAQAGAQRLARRWLEHQAAQQEYAGLFAGIGVQAVALLRQRLEELGSRDEAVTSLRQLYHLWVDCCEEAYASAVGTDEYSRLYGRLINTLMAVKQDGQHLADDALGMFGMPTRSELETLHRRFQDERRRARRAEEALAELTASAGDAKPMKKGKKKKGKKGKGGGKGKKKSAPKGEKKAAKGGARKSSPSEGRPGT